MESSPTRDRLLSAADRLFYANGIRAVPVDQVIAEAGVTRATFYRHFPGRGDLVLAYVRGRDQAFRAAAHAAASRAGQPGDMLRALVEGIADELCQPGFRGCPFINAAAEFPDPVHPVRAAVAVHRAWFLETLTGVLVAMGQPEPEPTAAILLMLRDGAMIGGYLGDPAAAAANLADAVNRLI